MSAMAVYLQTDHVTCTGAANATATLSLSLRACDAAAIRLLDVAAMVYAAPTRAHPTVAWDAVPTICACRLRQNY